MFKAPVDSDSEDEEQRYAARDGQLHPPQAFTPPLQQCTSQSPGLTNPPHPDDSSGATQAIPQPLQQQQQRQQYTAAPVAGPMQRLFGRWSRSSSGGDTSANSQPTSSPRTAAQNPFASNVDATQAPTPAASGPAEPTGGSREGSGPHPRAQTTTGLAGSVQGLRCRTTAKQQQQQQQQTRGRVSTMNTSPFAAAEASRSSLRPRAGKRQWPFSASAAGAAATSPANISAAAAAAAAAAAGAGGGAFASGCMNAATDGMPSAPPLSCLIAEQEQQQRLKRQHVMQQQQQPLRQNSPAAAASSRQFIPTGSRHQQHQQQQQQDPSEAPGQQQQQQQCEQQRQRTRKRTADGAVGSEQQQQQQQQQQQRETQEWRWPTSRGEANSPVHGWCKVTATTAAAAVGAEGCVGGEEVSIGCVAEAEALTAAAAVTGTATANKRQHTNTAAAAAAAGVSAGVDGRPVRSPAVKRHAAVGDLQAEQAQQQQQQEGHLQSGARAAAAAAKRLHAADSGQQPRQPAAAEAAAAADCRDNAAMDGASDVDTDMPQAVSVMHKRSHTDGLACQQQQQQQDAGASGEDATLLNSTHAQQQQRPQQRGMKAARLSPASTAAAEGQAFSQRDHAPQAGQDANDPSSSSRMQLLSALQASFPSLVTVLAALQSGGLAGCLQGPCGPAAAALMSRPAGQHLLQSFVELAGNEALLAAALHHHQGSQHQQQQQQQQASMRSPAAHMWHGTGIGQQGTPSTPPSAAAAAAGTPAAAVAIGTAAAASPIPVRSPALGHALQQLQESVAEGEVAAAVQLMSSLSLAFELQQEGRDVSSALQGAQQQLQQLQQLSSDLKEKLDLAERQQEQLQQQREAAAAAAAAELRTTHDQLERALLCQICFERPKDTVLMPCMHFLYCSGCLAAAKTPGKKATGGSGVAAGGSKGDEGAVLKCPVCRVPCSGQLVVHLSPL